MNLRLVLCIAMGVFVAHIGLFMFLAQLRPKPKFVPRPKPNFSVKATAVVDADTGEKLVHREFTISTKFAPAPAPAPPTDAVFPVPETPAGE